MSGRKQTDCAFCAKEKLSKDEIAINKKLLPRQIERMMCLACMAEYFDTTEEYLKDQIDFFKRQGCELFW